MDKTKAKWASLGGALAVAIFCGVALAQTPLPPPATAAAAPAAAGPPPAPPQLPPDVPTRPYKVVPGPQTLNPGEWPLHFPFSDEYDSAVAASGVHHVRYVDDHVRFVEVAYFPGVRGRMHGHPFPSVFAQDAPAPANPNVSLDPQRGMRVGRAAAPAGATFPTCNSATPQGPHAETGTDTFPHHFYRIEYFRVDGAGIQKNWKEWYPRASDPTVVAKPAAKGPNLSAAWPYPASLDSYKASPNTNRLLWEDGKMRLIEVLIRPGETEAMHGNPYPSVLAFDADSGVSPTVKFMDAKSPLNGQGRVDSAILAEFPTIRCANEGPRAPYAITNTGKTPIHYYRIEFKRIDGDGLKTKWREWYPWMAKLTDEYAKNKWELNY